MRESRSLGSVGAKAEWLSYPTVPVTSLYCRLCSTLNLPVTRQELDLETCWRQLAVVNAVSFRKMFRKWLTCSTRKREAESCGPFGQPRPSQKTGWTPR